MSDQTPSRNAHKESSQHDASYEGNAHEELSKHAVS